MEGGDFIQNPEGLTFTAVSVDYSKPKLSLLSFFIFSLHYLFILSFLYIFILFIVDFLTYFYILRGEHVVGGG